MAISDVRSSRTQIAVSRSAIAVCALHSISRSVSHCLVIVYSAVMAQARARGPWPSHVRRRLVPTHRRSLRNVFSGELGGLNKVVDGLNTVFPVGGSSSEVGDGMPNVCLLHSCRESLRKPSRHSHVSSLSSNNRGEMNVHQQRYPSSLYRDQVE